MDKLIGQSLGRYHILDKLGEGGMATVYKAFDTRLERDVAIKIIRREAFPPIQVERMLKRFEREARALGRLSHPSIVKVYDFGDYEGSPFLVMEYLPGGTLKHMLGKPIPWQEAARVIFPIADALQYAHEEGIIHRDVKPSNILITISGAPMLSDFGIAKILDSGEAATQLTGTGVGVGTPEYMAPEQWTGQVTTRSDIYSLGVVFYEMVTGRKPFSADTPAAILLKQVTESLPRPIQFAPGLPESVEKVLLKALSKSPDDRYGSMDGFSAALEALLTGKRRPVKPPVSAAVLPEDATSSPETIAQADSRETVFETGTQTSSVEQTPRSSDYFPKVDQPARRSPAFWTWFALAGAAGCLLLAGLGVVVGLAFGWFKSNPPTDAIPGDTNSRSPTRTSIVSLTPTLPPNIPTGTDAFFPSPTFTFSPSPTSTFTASPSATQTKTFLGRMLDIPAGGFTMGDSVSHAESLCLEFSGACDTITYSDESPAHSVYLDAYRIDQTEVTNAMYALCVAANKCTDNGKGSNNLPATNVSWFDAVAYCAWAGKRLPTEAEWEKAARGTDGRIFPWGNSAPNCSVANFDPTTGNACNGKAVPVGSYPGWESPYGAQDMAGNVWEWVADWFDGGYYSHSPASNPLGPGASTFRVKRGGSFINPEGYLIPTGRGMDYPETRSAWNGFRCAADQ